jgi:hypothetical protein
MSEKTKKSQKHKTSLLFQVRIFENLKIVNKEEHFRFKPWPSINPFNLTNTHLDQEPSP